MDLGFFPFASGGRVGEVRLGMEEVGISDVIRQENT